MIQKFIDKFIASKNKLRERLKQSHPDSYLELVKMLITILHDNDEFECPDPNRIHEIDDGDYQGTLVYIVAATGYQPSTYWILKVEYGSCSGCDTLQSICGYSNEEPTDEQIEDYLTLILHLVQSMKEF